MNPVALNIFGIEIRWYGILIAIGAMAGLLIARKNAKHVFLDSSLMEDYLILAIFPAIIGARLYYVIFKFDYYGFDIYKIINIRNGGLAVHGGLIVGFIIAYFFCKRRNVSMWDFLDVLASSIPIGQSIGRWGNYANSEAHGGKTDLAWAILVDGEKVHPTFLYESIATFLIFLFLFYLIRHRKFKGQILSFYLILYSIARFFIEGLRTDSLYIAGFKAAQLISVLFIIVGFIIYYIGNKRKKDGVLS